MSSLLESTDPAGLVRANSITDFRESSRSDNVPFSPKPLSISGLIQHPKLLNTEVVEVSHYEHLGASL